MKTNEIQTAAKAVLPATSNKGMIEGWDSIIFNKGELMAYNDKICMSSILEGSEKLSCAVNASDLVKVLEGLKDPEVDLKQKEGKLLLKSDSTEAEFTTLESMAGVLKMIEGVTVNIDDYIDLPKDFIKGLNLCQFAVSNDFNCERGLYALFIDGDTIYGGSNFRMSRYVLESNLEASILLPKSVLPNLVRFRPVAFQVGNGWAHFINEEETIMSCRTVNVTYPSIKAVMDSVNPKTKVKLPTELKVAVNSVIGVFSEVLEIDKVVNIVIDKGVLTCKIEKQSALWVKKKMPFENKKVSLTFTINSIFLAEILELTDELLIEATRAKFVSGTFDHLIMLGQEE